MSGVWDFFDKIYVISIPGSKLIDRLKINFEAVNLNKYEIIEFTPAKKTVNDGSNVKDLTLFELLTHDTCDDTCNNITNNHLSLIEKCYEDPTVSNVLIFEDDAEFEIPLNIEKVKRVIEWLKSNPWDMFYFGYCNFSNPFIYPVNKDIVRLPKPYLGHAYAVSRSGINYFAEHRSQIKDIQIDKFYSYVPLKKYGIFKSICFQAKDPALFSLAMKKMNLNVGLKEYSKTTENLSIILPIVILVLFLIIFIVLLYVFIQIYTSRRAQLRNNTIVIPLEVIKV